MNTTGVSYNTPGYYNPRSGEFHSMRNHNGSCHLDNAVRLERMTWGQAQTLDADLCGHEFPDKSQVNDTRNARINEFA